jgi:hypothetical protein
VLAGLTITWNVVEAIVAVAGFTTGDLTAMFERVDTRAGHHAALAA